MSRDQASSGPVAPRDCVMHNRGSRGEVAEPGLRRTPGTRVDSKGSRGFESPPLRQAVHDFRVLCRKDRKYRACSRTLSDLRAPEKLRFGRRQLIYARFSLSRIEPVPFAPSQPERGKRTLGEASLARIIVSPHSSPRTPIYTPRNHRRGTSRSALSDSAARFGYDGARESGCSRARHPFRRCVTDFEAARARS